MWDCKIGDLLYYVAVQYSADGNWKNKGWQMPQIGISYKNVTYTMNKTNQDKNI